MASMKTIIAENVQRHLKKANWMEAISEMEKLFAIQRDPHIRVRIGNVRRKLNREREAIQEYLYAADLFAEMGFIMKALAQYRLAMRLDPSNTDIRDRREQLRTSCTIVQWESGPVEYRPPEPFEVAKSLRSTGEYEKPC